MRLTVPILLNCFIVIAVYLMDKYTPAKRLPEKAKQITQIIIDVIEIAVLAMLTWVSAQYVMNSWTRVTDVLMMPRWYFSIAVPIGFGWSLLYAIYYFVLDLLGKGKEEESHDTGVY